MDLRPAQDPAIWPVIYHVYPALVFVFFLTSSLASTFVLPQTHYGSKIWVSTRRRAYILLLALIIMTYLVQLACLVFISLAESSWPPRDYLVVGALSCLLIFGMQLSYVLEASRSPLLPLRGCWMLALAFEIIIVTITFVHPSASHPKNYHMAQASLALVRCLSLLFLLAWSFLGPWPSRNPISLREERQPLLSSSSSATRHPQSNCPGYGSTLDNGSPSVNDAEQEEEGCEIRHKQPLAMNDWLEHAKNLKVGYDLSSLPLRKQYLG